MTNTPSMRRALTSTAILATLALIATLLTGINLSPASAGPGYQKPKVGQCRNLTGAQSRAKTNSTKPVSCSSTHTARTIAVGKLSARVWKSRAKTNNAVASKCQKAWNKAVGRSTSLRLRSSFALSTFTPTKAQRKKGARWYRCDVVVLRGSGLTPLKTTQTPLLSSPIPSHQARCLTASSSKPTTCDVPHSYKATATFKLKGKKFPGKAGVKKAAKKGCNARVSTSSYRYDAPSKADWNDGNKYVICFSAHKLPPPPPPVDPDLPTSTMVVPTGAVPFGTDVTVTGLATDDEAVSPLTATVRNAGGLYLQDNGAINSTVNTYPITIASGGYNTSSVGWSMSFNDALPVGTYTVALTVKDSDNQTVVVTKSFTVTAAPDTTKPTASLSSPPSNITTSVNLVISGTANDNVQVAGLTVQLKRNSDGLYLQDSLGNNFAATNANGLNVNPTGLGTSTASFGLDTGKRAVGSYTVEVSAQDASGNVTAPLVTKTVTVTAATGGSEVYYAMNEAGGATTMNDTGSSGLGLDGVIDQDGLNTGVAKSGATSYEWAFTSPENPPAKPERVIQVPDDAALDAGSDTFTVEVRYQTVNSFGNVMQKGQSGSVGGQWKIQQPGGYPSCLFKRRTAGVDYQISVQSTVDFSVGSWHTLKCVRSGNNVTMFVDGVYNGQKNADAGVTIGTISNTVPLTIGGKINCDQITTTCDYFTGWIDYVRLTHG